MWSQVVAWPLPVWASSRHVSEWLEYGTEDFDPLVTYSSRLLPSFQRFVHEQLWGRCMGAAKAFGDLWGIDVRCGNTGVTCSFNPERVVVLTGDDGRIRRTHPFG